MQPFSGLWTDGVSPEPASCGDVDLGSDVLGVEPDEHLAGAGVALGDLLAWPSPA